MKKNISLVFVLVLLSLAIDTRFIVQVKAEPKTIYVDDDNTTGPWDGTPGRPYQNITSALEQASVNDTIFVYNGTYYENVWVDKTVSLIGENRSNTIIEASEPVVRVTWANNVTISGFTIKQGGIKLQWSDHGIVTGNTIMGLGIGLLHSSHNDVSQNIVTGSGLYEAGSGVSLYYSANNTVANNVLTNSSCGIYLYCSSNCSIHSNNVNNNQHGIKLEFGSDDNVFRSNDMRGNRYNLFVTMSYFQDIDTSNTVDGKPVYYLVNQHDLTINPVTYPEIGYLAAVNSTNIKVENLTLTNNGQGMLFAYTTNLTIKNVTTTDNVRGIQLTVCSNCSVSDSNVKDNRWEGICVQYSPNCSIYGNNVNNSGGFGGIYFHCPSNGSVYSNNVNNNTNGIWLEDSSNCSIYGNNVTNNHLYYGIYLGGWSSDNILTSNKLTNNWDGICLGGWSSNNSFTNNNIRNNELGIRVDSSNNIIYHNNFVDNTEQVHSYNSTNIWDDGCPSGGNYWSNYAGVDVKSGPNQDQPGSDGIGDTPYDIDANNTDHYPLMYPWGSPPPPSYTLTIHSSPTGVTFTVDGIPCITPWSGTYSEGSSVSLVMPVTHDGYVWSHWLEDGDTDRIKTVTMDTDITLTAVFTPDTTPPTISIASPENKTYAVKDIPLTFTVSESTSWMGYSLDGQMNITISGNTTIVDLSDGTHTVTVYANDTAGNMGHSDIAYFTIQTAPIDTTPPSISIVSPENKTYDTTDLPLTFTVDESVLWMAYSLDGQANVTITGNTTLSGLSEGSHSLIVYAKDMVGNTGASEIIYFTIETKEEEAFPVWILASIVIIAVVGTALLVYFAKIKKTTAKVK